MSIQQKLHTKLVQKLILTPSLQQAIKLLPMTTIEAAPPPPPEKRDPRGDDDYAYFFGEYLDDGYRPRTPQEVKELPPIENTLSTASSLADHLMWQLSPRGGRSPL